MPSAALIRRVTGIYDKAVMRITVGWNAPSDVDVFVQEPDYGESPILGKPRDRERLDPGWGQPGDRCGRCRTHGNGIAAGTAGSQLAGEYRVFIHQYDDHGLNEPVDVTVDVELYEGARVRESSVPAWADDPQRPIRARRGDHCCRSF